MFRQRAGRVDEGGASDCGYTTLVYEGAGLQMVS